MYIKSAHDSYKCAVRKEIRIRVNAGEDKGGREVLAIKRRRGLNAFFVGFRLCWFDRCTRRAAFVAHHPHRNLQEGCAYKMRIKYVFFCILIVFIRLRDWDNLVDFGLKFVFWERVYVRMK